MTSTKTHCDQVKTLLVRSGTKATSGRVKILAVIVKHDDMDFTNIDIYKLLQEERENISMASITSNLKKLTEAGLLTSSKRNVAARLYRKCRDFENIRPIDDSQSYLFK